MRRVNLHATTLNITQCLVNGNRIYFQLVLPWITGSFEA
jgi:hypothetical protein